MPAGNPLLLLPSRSAVYAMRHRGYVRVMPAGGPVLLLPGRAAVHPLYAVRYRLSMCHLPTGAKWRSGLPVRAERCQQ